MHFLPSLKSRSHSIRANWYTAFNSARISSSPGLLLFTERSDIQVSAYLFGCEAAQALTTARWPSVSPKFAILKSEAGDERVRWPFNDANRVSSTESAPNGGHPPNSPRTQRNTFKSPLMKHLSITPLPLPYTCLEGGIWKWLKWRGERESTREWRGEASAEH